MTTSELRAELDALNEQVDALDTRRREVRLAIEEAEGRGDGREAVWLRAVLTSDHATADRCYSEWVVGEGSQMHERSVQRAREALAKAQSAASGAPL